MKFLFGLTMAGLCVGAKVLAQTPTPTWTDFYSTGTTLNGSPLPAGYKIEAFDRQGVKCGSYTLSIPGTYGYLHAYGDDATTPSVDEGASAGDTIAFRVLGHLGAPSAAPIWFSGNPGAILPIDLAFTNSSPSFAFRLPDTVISENQPLSITYIGNDDDGDDVTLAYVSGPPGASFAVNGTFSWTPTYTQAGVYKLIVSVTDLFETIYDTAQITVTNINRAPSAARLLRPVDQDTIKLVTIPRPVAFSWLRSIDADEEDTVRYLLTLQGPALDTVLTGLTDTSANLDIMSKLQVAAVYKWTIDVTDGSNTVASPDTFFFRTSSTITGILDIHNEIARKFELHQNYPNPFNPRTTIKYDIAQTVHVRIIIYDILGQRIEELVNEEQSPGRYRIEWTPANRSSGVYFYKLKAGDFTAMKKLMFVK